MQNVEKNLQDRLERVEQELKRHWKARVFDRILRVALFLGYVAFRVVMHVMGRA